MSFLNAHLTIPGDHPTTLQFCVQHFITTCQSAIRDHGFFTVALSGGSTPQSIYKLLCEAPFSEQIEWSKIHLFWSDERAAAAHDPESNYHMAMKAGFEKMNIPFEHIHRMEAEDRIQINAQKYEHTIRSLLSDESFDLVILGMGEDGHTASLFPFTDGLKSIDPYVIANYIPYKQTWRMTLTFKAINQAKQTVFYVLGESKAKMLAHVFNTKPYLPCQFVGTLHHPALWIADLAATSQMNPS